ncbi:MAG TPA: O-antigen ligase family protein [Gaiellaceae bacterium]|nr:O-antigen ligase family protein [Gaiellaceae bacterium]
MTRSLALRGNTGSALLAGASARAGAAAPIVLAAAATGLIAADHGGYWPTSWGWTTLVLAAVALVGLALGIERPSAFELGWVVALLAVCAWTAASGLWTLSGTATALEVERSLVYAMLAIAAVCVVRRATLASIVWGVWAGATLITIYALATRLFPERLGVTDTIAGYRLATPVGYWNGLGLVTATAALLALGLVVEGTPLVPRVLAGASLPLVLPTLYFTFSRGAWIALAVAVLLVVAVSPRRLSYVSALVVVGAPAAGAVALAYHARALRLVNVPLAQAVGAGHTLAWRLALTALCGAAAGLLWATVGSRLSVPRPVRLAYGAAVAAAAVAVVAGVLVHYGGPSAAFDRARQSLEGGSPLTGQDLSRHLLTLSSPARVDQWHVALDQWRANRVVGSGAGTYSQFWMAARSDRPKVDDAHNLYVETLGELGLVGLVLLAAALALPLAGAVRERRTALVPLAGAAFSAWCVHAAYDWDWELPGVTIGAFLCAAAALAATRRAPAATGRSLPALLAAGALAVGVVGTLGLVGNRAFAQSVTASSRGDLASALADARRARTFSPWSSQPWLQIGNIRLAQGRRAEALAAYERAASKDPNDWSTWLVLAGASRGAERARAVAELRLLAPSVAASFAAGSGP